MCNFLWYQVESLIWFPIFPVANQAAKSFDSDGPQPKCVANVFEKY